VKFSLIRRVRVVGCLLATACVLTPEALAVVPADQLLPANTVGFVAIANPSDFADRFETTDFGRLASDPSMKPFADQIRDQLSQRFGNLQARLGITIDDLRGIASGELALAMLPQTSGPAVSVLSVDTRGNAERRDALVARIEQTLADEGSQRTQKQVGNLQLIVHTVPPTDGRPQHTAVWFVADEQLVAVSNMAVAERLANSMATPPADSLSKAASYRYVMDTVAKEAIASPADLVWYVDPFGYGDAVRSIAKYEGRDDDETAESQLLRKQGFDAVKGIGGNLHVAIDAQHNFVHRTAAHAPADPKATSPDKYRLAMRMLKLPNRGDMTVEPWVPRMIASYTTVNIDLLNAFDTVGSLFDAIAGYADAFDTMIDRFENDPFGPRIKFRDEIIKSLGSRVSLVNDYVLPINPKSERFLLAIEVKPGMEATLRQAIGKYVESDGYKKIELEGQEVWEFQPVDETLTSGYDEESLLPGIGPQEQQQTDPDERLLIRSAVAVTPAHLLISSDTELLRQAFRQQQAASDALDQSFDFLDVAASLEKYGSDERSSWSFYRIDERLRPGYELLRQGRMPESETFLGRALNEILTSAEEEDSRVLRKQRVDADQLPSFELARRYFGPAGQSVRTDADGWLVSGVLLAK
jgi:hypothetical protein